MRNRIRGGTVPAIVAFVLAIIYGATLAPGLTLWDSGEFLSAIHSLGIPHPPGTPLYIIVASTWSRVFGPVLGFARSVNALSAVATAAGCTLLAWSVARWTGSRLSGIAAGIAAGSMLSVWRSATETEVYALSFALSLVTLVLADRAGRSGHWRDALLVVYALSLGAALHLSALVLAPAVVWLAATDGTGRLHVPRAVQLAGTALLAISLGSAAPRLAAAAILVVLAGSLARREEIVARRWLEATVLTALVALAASASLVMLARAPFDPFVNQGDPATWDRFVSVLRRSQYDVPPLWPRRAPLWLQVANVFQYADWQVAFALDDWVGASLRRTPLTVAFGVLAVLGARWHRARDRRSFRGMLLALASASLGAVLMLNLQAGPSFGADIVPADAHEARERDYFFATAFALAAAWAGIGAARLGGALTARVARRRAHLALPGTEHTPSGQSALGAALTVAILAAPIVLNWRAADRSRPQQAALASRFADALLAGVPRNAVFLVAGDNDTYPLWYKQQVEGRRRDVTVVTIPLLPAAWYRAELSRRSGLLPPDTAAPWRGIGTTLRALAERADRAGRPIAAAISVPYTDRAALGAARRWTLRGPVFVVDPEVSPTTVGVHVQSDTLVIHPIGHVMLGVDTSVLLPARGPRVRHRADQTERYIAALLECPYAVVATVRRGGGSVDPICNLR
ncbi:MAG: glycosyltransferase family 117 protein [Gemmatimonadaceae bacterium]